MTTLDLAIRAEAMSFLGTPFRHGASLRGSGIDCIHLVCAVLRATGMLAADAVIPRYPPDWMIHRREERLVDGLRVYCDEVYAPFRVGDILTYKFGHAASHCGIYVGNNQVVHAATRDRVRCDPVDIEPLKARYAGAYRVRR
jgi:NlpC/P60 family putative phage cell wall peptidase